MPELPEVEVVRRGVADHAVGRRISTAQVLHPRAVRQHVPGLDDFAARLRDRRLRAACRRGKYLWLELSESDHDPAEALVTHLGMSGQLLIQPADAPDEKHLRTRLCFDDGGSELRFVDQRTFGGLYVADLVDSDTLVPAPIAHIAPDPLEENFEAESVVTTIRSRRTSIKRALLDQTVVSGIGNIYADEALWRAKLHWACPTATVSRPAVRALLAAVIDVLGEAMAAGGTSFDALYVNVNGESGYFDRALAAYGREGLPCLRCGTPILRERFMNRSSHFCPRCQRKR